MLTYSLDPQDSWNFACLSGDFNPLHVDPVAARRLQFGGTVCHGVHLVLKALDLAVTAQYLEPAEIETMSAVFSGSARTGCVVDVEVNPEPERSRIRFVASSEGRALFTTTISLAESRPAGPLPLDCVPAEREAPESPQFPDAGSVSIPSSSVELRMNSTLFGELFPSLARRPLGSLLTADLLATTEIVGMKCPGMHSIYSEFKLRRREHDPSRLENRMSYAIDRVDPRFRSVRLRVTGRTFEGTLGTFFRAPAVKQVMLSELANRVEPGRFVGQRALVVGGSRGLGELVSKILLAGGADVTLSYVHGREDAERVQAEALGAGATARIFALDAGSPISESVGRMIRELRLSHLYYLATPYIGKQSPNSWNPSLFDNYCQIYVHGFRAVVEAAIASDTASRGLTVLYPSSIFLDRAEAGFAEYCAAKAAGERLCDHLALQPGVTVNRPRLPRMQTDQNSSFMGVEGHDPLPIMLKLLLSLHPVNSDAPAIQNGHTR